MFLLDDDNDDHGVRRANMAQALARWWHLGASNEATETLNREMCLAPYCPGWMVVAFVVDCVTFFYIVDNRVAKYKLIAPLFYRIYQIASPSPSTMPSSASPLRWIGSNHKIRAAVGGGSSPWWGCLFLCCVLWFNIDSYVENQRSEICTYLKSTISFPPEPLSVRGKLYVTVLKSYIRSSICRDC